MVVVDDCKDARKHGVECASEPHVERKAGMNECKGQDMKLCLEKYSDRSDPPLKGGARRFGRKGEIGFD